MSYFNTIKVTPLFLLPNLKKNLFCKVYCAKKKVMEVKSKVETWKEQKLSLRRLRMMYQQNKLIRVIFQHLQL